MNNEKKKERQRVTENEVPNKTLQNIVTLKNVTREYRQESNEWKQNSFICWSLKLPS